MELNQALLKLKQHFYTISKQDRIEYEKILYGIIDSTNKDMIFLFSGNYLLNFHILFSCLRESGLFTFGGIVTDNQFKTAINDINAFLKRYESE